MEFTGTSSYKCVGNAGSKILLAHHKQFYMKPIHFEIDNTTALSYLENEYLIELAKEIWKYLQQRGIANTSEYPHRSVHVETIHTYVL